MEKRKEIGKRIQQLRKSAGISQEELSVKANYKNRSSIARIENGSTDIPAEKLRIIAELLGTNTLYLETGIDFTDYAFDPEEYSANDELTDHLVAVFKTLSENGRKKVVEFVEYIAYSERKTEEEML